MSTRKQNPFEVRHPVFRPLWRRVLITGFTLGWSAVEFSNASPFWAILFGACGVHLFIQFFVKFDPADYEPRKNEDTP